MPTGQANKFFRIIRYMNSTQKEKKLSKESMIEDMSPMDLIGLYSTNTIRKDRLEERTELMELYRTFLERCEDESIVKLMLQSLVDWIAENGDEFFYENAKTVFNLYFGESPRKTASTQLH